MSHSRSQNPHIPGMGQSNIHLDILMGRDEMLEPADLFLGLFLLCVRVLKPLRIRLGMEHGPSFSIHSEMEKKLRI
jgi:proteasome maturation protein